MTVRNFFSSGTDLLAQKIVGGKRLNRSKREGFSRLLRQNANPGHTGYVSKPMSGLQLAPHMSL